MIALPFPFDTLRFLGILLFFCRWYAESLNRASPHRSLGKALRKRSHAVILSDFARQAAEVIYNPTSALQGHETNQTKKRTAHSQTSYPTG